MAAVGGSPFSGESQVEGGLVGGEESLPFSGDGAGGASVTGGEGSPAGGERVERSSPVSGESVVGSSPVSGDGVGAASVTGGEGSPAGGERAVGSSPVSGEKVEDPSPEDGDGVGGTSPMGGDIPGATSVSPVNGDTSGAVPVSPENDDASGSGSASRMGGDVSGSADVSPVSGDGLGSGGVSGEVSPVSGETESTAAFGDARPVSGNLSADEEKAALTSMSPVSGDGGEPPAGAGFFVRNRRVAVVLAVVVVVVAAVTVALQVLPRDGGQAQSGNVAATSAVSAEASARPSAAASAPASAAPSQVPSQPGVPQAGEFGAWASRTSQWLDIPLRAMTGYARATVTLGKEQPGCHLSWITLAAIGKVTSDHGRAQSGQLGDNGTLAKPLGTVEVLDFYHRPVSTPGAAGPLQLSPAVWSKWQQSASGGKPDIQNVDDAALTAGRALCANGRDLATDWWNGVSTLEPAPVVLHRTLATTNVYGTVGQSAQPPNPAVLTAVDFAIDQIGLPYVWGGNGTHDADPGFDCSGLTTAAYASADVKLMRTADTQFRSVAHVGEPQLGDLIFYGEPATKIHHVGLYIGNQQMIDAPQTGQAVQVHPYRKPGDDYAGAGRPTA